MLPIFEIRAYNSTLTDFEISRDDVEKKLMSLNSNKAAGPHNGNFRVKLSMYDVIA